MIKNSKVPWIDPSQQFKVKQDILKLRIPRSYALAHYLIQQWVSGIGANGRKMGQNSWTMICGVAIVGFGVGISVGLSVAKWFKNRKN